jgi:hypothetical protein
MFESAEIPHRRDLSPPCIDQIRQRRASRLLINRRRRGFAEFWIGWLSVDARPDRSGMDTPVAQGRPESRFSCRTSP